MRPELIKVKKKCTQYGIRAWPAASDILLGKKKTIVGCEESLIKLIFNMVKNNAYVIMLSALKCIF